MTSPRLKCRRSSSACTVGHLLRLRSREGFVVRRGDDRLRDARPGVQPREQPVLAPFERGVVVFEGQETRGSSLLQLCLQVAAQLRRPGEVGEEDLPPLLMKLEHHLAQQPAGAFVDGERRA